MKTFVVHAKVTDFCSACCCGTAKDPLFNVVFSALLLK